MEKDGYYCMTRLCLNCTVALDNYMCFKHIVGTELRKRGSNSLLKSGKENLLKSIIGN